MKNKVVKKLITITALTLTCGMIAGCGNVVSDLADTPVEKEADEPEHEEKQETSQDDSAIETESDDTDEEIKESETVEDSGVDEESKAMDNTEATEETDAVADTNVALSGDWKDMQFTFDGKNYQMPFSYKDLEAAGWTFNLADYGYENGYIMNPNDKTYGTIELTNPAYDENLTLNVGFINTGDSAQDILDCDIWSFEYNTCRGFDQLENFPSMTIGNGITIGSTKSEVEAACGPCEEIYEATEHGYVNYSYSIENYTLKLTIYDDKGVTAIELSQY